MDGDTDTVVDAYVADVAGSRPSVVAAAPIVHHRTPPVVAGLADVRLLGMDLVAPDGQRRWQMRAGERMTVRVHYQARGDFPDAAIVLTMYDADDQTLVCSYNSHVEQTDVSLQNGKNWIDLDDVLFPLRAGRYTVTVALFRQPDAPHWATPDDVQHKAYMITVDSPFTQPQKRWGSGDVIVTDVRICNADGKEQHDFATGETLRLCLRCMSTGAPVHNPMLRVLLTDSHGVLLHATNSARAEVALGDVTEERAACLTYEQLHVLEGDYVLSVGAMPAGAVARRPYDWHDGAYRFHVHSSERDGAGIVNLPHHWTVV